MSNVQMDPSRNRQLVIMGSIPALVLFCCCVGIICYFRWKERKKKADKKKKKGNRPNSGPFPQFGTAFDDDCTVPGC
eukprot:gene25552-1703_t